MTRADMDKFALRCHELAIQATDEGRLPEEIVPVTIKLEEGRHDRRGGRGAARATPRSRRSPKLHGPIPQGRHAHGRQRARASTTAPARWCSRATSGRRRTAAGARHDRRPRPQVADDFPYLARTPANATKLALEKAGLSVDDIDLFEINEAFASVALNSMRMLDVDEDEGERERRRDRARPPDRRQRRAHPDDARERAAPPRRRPRRGGDLLRRRPGRRGHRRGQRQR